MKEGDEEGDEEQALKIVLRSYKLSIRDVTLHSLVKIAAKRLGQPHFGGACLPHLADISE